MTMTKGEILANRIVDAARGVLRTYGVGRVVNASQWADDINEVLDHFDTARKIAPDIRLESVIPTREQFDNDHMAFHAVHKLILRRASAGKPLPDPLPEYANALAAMEPKALSGPQATRSRGLGEWKAPHARWAVGCAIHLVHQSLDQIFNGNAPKYSQDDLQGSDSYDAAIEVVREALQAEDVRHGLEPGNLKKCLREFRKEMPSK